MQKFDAIQPRREQCLKVFRHFEALLRYFWGTYERIVRHFYEFWGSSRPRIQLCRFIGFWSASLNAFSVHKFLHELKICSFIALRQYSISLMIIFLGIKDRLEKKCDIIVDDAYEEAVKRDRKNVYGRFMTANRWERNLLVPWCQAENIPLYRMLSRVSRVTCPRIHTQRFIIYALIRYCQRRKRSAASLRFTALMAFCSCYDNKSPSQRLPDVLLS